MKKFTSIAMAALLGGFAFTANAADLGTPVPTPANGWYVTPSMLVPAEGTLYDSGNEEVTVPVLQISWQTTTGNVTTVVDNLAVSTMTENGITVPNVVFNCPGGKVSTAVGAAGKLSPADENNVFYVDLSPIIMNGTSYNYGTYTWTVQAGAVTSGTNANTQFSGTFTLVQAFNNNNWIVDPASNATVNGSNTTLTDDMDPYYISDLSDVNIYWKSKPTIQLLTQQASFWTSVSGLYNFDKEIVNYIQPNAAGTALELDLASLIGDHPEWLQDLLYQAGDVNKYIAFTIMPYSLLVNGQLYEGQVYARYIVSSEMWENPIYVYDNSGYQWPLFMTSLDQAYVTWGYVGINFTEDWINQTGNWDPSPDNPSYNGGIDLYFNTFEGVQNNPGNINTWKRVKNLDPKLFSLTNVPNPNGAVITYDNAVQVDLSEYYAQFGAGLYILKIPANFVEDQYGVANSAVNSFLGTEEVMDELLQYAVTITNYSSYQNFLEQYPVSVIIYDLYGQDALIEWTTTGVISVSWPNIDRVVANNPNQLTGLQLLYADDLEEVTYTWTGTGLYIDPTTGEETTFTQVFTTPWNLNMSPVFAEWPNSTNPVYYIVQLRNLKQVANQTVYVESVDAEVLFVNETAGETLPEGEYVLYIPEMFSLLADFNGNRYLNAEQYSDVIDWSGDSIDDSTTAVESVEVENGVYTVYNLQGMKVMETANAANLKALKGIFIVNGKKVVIK